MNKQEINQIIKELEQRGYTVQYNPPPKQQHYGGGGNGVILLLIAGIVAFGLWSIFSVQSQPIQGSTPVLIQPTLEYTITESEAVILATSTQIAYPTVAPTITTFIEPMLQATLAGEWPRPITPEQFEMCKINPNINPACEDYLK